MIKRLSADWQRAFDFVYSFWSVGFYGMSADVKFFAFPPWRSASRPAAAGVSYSPRGARAVRDGRA